MYRQNRYIGRMEWLNFRHLYSFWAVCRYGGFQKAAEKLHVTQSTISEQVLQLEEYLEEQLLERTTRSFKITARGAALLGYADEIFDQSQAINHLFRDKRETLAPTEIRVGLVGGISRNFVYGLVAKNLGAAGAPKIKLIDGSLDELNSLLKDYELDLIFSLEVPGKKDLLSLSYKQVEASSLCIAGKKQLVDAVKNTRRKNTLSVSVFMFHHPFEGDLLTDVIGPRYNLECEMPVLTDDISLLRFLANSGSGVAVLPEIGVREDLGEGRITSLRLEGVPKVAFYAVFLKSGFHRELIDKFLP